MLVNHLVCSAAFLLGTGVILCAATPPLPAEPETFTGTASWYGEPHRGKTMANGHPFDPDQLTAASWFYPLGTKLHVTLANASPCRTVTITVTDRGPAKQWVRRGRIIDLSYAAFKTIADPAQGLVRVRLSLPPPP